MENLIDANYHSHTSRCGHAYGKDEEYVKAALSQGFKVLGFSDHVMLPGVVQKGMRGDYSLLDDYIDSVLSLKNEYQGRIEILLAFECEWYSKEFADYYRDLLEKRGFDYLILGQHCRRVGGRITFYSNFPDRKQAVEQYAKDLIEGMESRLFAYVAHPDNYLLWHDEWDEVSEKAAWMICKKAKELNLPLEINMGPSRWKGKTSPDDLSFCCYPYPKFFEIAKEIGNEVIIGVDAHSPSDYLNSDFGWAADFARKMGLSPLKRLILPSRK